MLGLDSFNLDMCAELKLFKTELIGNFHFETLLSHNVIKHNPYNLNQPTLIYFNQM
jgi:hypothetical protein